MSKPEEDGFGSDSLRRGNINGNSVDLDDEQVKTYVNCVKPSGGKGKTNGNSVELDDELAQINANCIKPEGRQGKANGNSVVQDDEQVELNARWWEGQDQWKLC